MRGVINGFLAGLCIAIGGSVYSSCENRYVGAFLFSVALFTICVFGFSLYTGKIGYIVENHKKSDFAVLFSGLLGNAIGCALFGVLISIAQPQLAAAAQTICTAKLAQGAIPAVIRAFFCGVLMYIAVQVYKVKDNPIGIFICIPVFILSGFEHSIANMFYFSAAGFFNLPSLYYIALIVLGNSLGGMCIPFFEKFTKEKIKF